MSRIPRYFAAALTSSVLAGGAAAPVPTAAQAGWSYTVRDADATRTRPGAEAADLDVATDRNPMHVVQGPEFTWVVPEGRALTRENAAMILYDNVPVNAGTGDLLVRGWRPVRVARHDSFSVTLGRGDDDREVAGRAADHYVLRAHVDRIGSVDGTRQRYDVVAELWILPDLPHSWAPFGVGTWSLPAQMPRLRDVLDPRLAELGLVGRAVIRLDLGVGDADGSPSTTSTRASVFEVFDLTRTERPPVPGPVIDRTVLTSVEETLMRSPAGLCRSIAHGELPSSIHIAHEPARGPLEAHVNAACGSPELYFAMIEDELEADPGALCRKVDGAGNPRELAEAIFNEAQRTAFLQVLPPTERTGFHAELQRFCAARSRDDGSRTTATAGTGVPG